MSRLMKQRSQKAGLPPGTLVHIGVQKTQKTRIEILDYDESRSLEKEIETVDECRQFRDAETVTWINVEGLHQVDLLEKLNECFGLHPLVMEDILNTDQRPKMEDYDDYAYIVLRLLYSNDTSDRIDTEQISLILGSHYVISFQERGSTVFAPVRERIRNGKGRIRQMGADYLAYALIDSVVDNYFLTLEKLGERIEFLEDELVANPTRNTLQMIHSLKSDMILLRRSVWPLREVVGGLERGESPLMKDPIRPYLRDIYDHTIQVIDTVETFRDMLSGMLDIYLSSISNRSNEVMKVPTIIATIFMPLTFIVGVYGMNFRYMPELERTWGYPVILLVMFAIGVSMLVYFRRRKWL